MIKLYLSQDQLNQKKLSLNEIYNNRITAR